MGNKSKIEAAYRDYRGVMIAGAGCAVEWQFIKTDGRSLFDMSTMRFSALDGASSAELLERLVNLPDDVNSAKIASFINDYHNLRLGATTSGGQKAEAMTPAEVIRYRGLYRIFWELPKHSGGNAIRADIFVTLLGPQPDALQATDPKGAGDPYPLHHFAHSALRIDWETGRFKITARGPIDLLTHEVFRNRNRLLVCSNPKCQRGSGGARLFIASTPNGKFCSAECGLEIKRKGGRTWWRENRGSKRTKGW